MNAPEAFARELEYYFVYAEAASQKNEELKKSCDLKLRYNGSIAKMFHDYGESFMDIEVPSTLKKSFQALMYNLYKLFYWSWYVRKVYSFDVKSQQNLKKIDLSGLKWSDLYLPFPVIFLEFQAEFFLWEREYDSAIFSSGENDLVQITFFSRKRAGLLPDNNSHVEVLHLLRQGKRTTKVEKLFRQATFSRSKRKLSSL